MPTVFRSMKQAVDGLPVVGQNSKELGVRVPPDPNADVGLDGQGNVLCDGRGLSVAESWRNLLAHLGPKRLRPLFAGAAGSNTLVCWRYGSGPFVPAQLNAQLELVLKKHDPQTGNVVPVQPVSVQAFQADLAATRTRWLVDET